MIRLDVIGLENKAGLYFDTRIKILVLSVYHLLIAIKLDVIIRSDLRKLTKGFLAAHEINSL